MRALSCEQQSCLLFPLLCVGGQCLDLRSRLGWMGNYTTEMSVNLTYSDAWTEDKRPQGRDFLHVNNFVSRAGSWGPSSTTWTPPFTSSLLNQDCPLGDSDGMWVWRPLPCLVLLESGHRAWDTLASCHLLTLLQGAWATHRWFCHLPVPIFTYFPIFPYTIIHALE